CIDHEDRRGSVGCRHLRWYNGRYFYPWCEYLPAGGHPGGCLRLFGGCGMALLKPGEDMFSVEIVINPLINIVLSMIIGSAFAFVSEMIVGMLGAQSGAPVEV